MTQESEPGREGLGDNVYANVATGVRGSPSVPHLHSTYYSDEVMMVVIFSCYLKHSVYSPDRTPKHKRDALSGARCQTKAPSSSNKKANK